LPAVSESWGNRFDGIDDIDSVVDLFLVGWAYYCIWWVGFTLWMMIAGLHYPEKGYETVFDELRKAHKFETISIFKGKSTRGMIAVYMAIHFLACSIGLAWSMLMWSSFWCRKYKTLKLNSLIIP